MRYIHLPGTELKPSAICLGTANLGWTTSEQESFRLLDAFLDLGGNFLDTAHMYADWAMPERSSSERLLGRWMAGGANRERVIVATKGGHPDLATGRSRLSPGEIRRDLLESLRFLDVQPIDLYWLHRDDPARPVGEMLEALEEARRQGLIRHYGCSNWRAGRMAEAREYAKEHGLQGFAANQPWWSLAEPKPETMAADLARMDREMYEFHRRTGLAAMPYSSQANGFFAGGYGREIADPVSPSAHLVKAMYYREENFARLDRAVSLGRELGRTANEVALAYLLNQDFPVFPIVGCHTVTQLAATCRAADLALSRVQVEYLVG